jgi:hypothetical protein
LASKKLKMVKNIMNSWQGNSPQQHLLLKRFMKLDWLKLKELGLKWMPLLKKLIGVEHLNLF